MHGVVDAPIPFTASSSGPWGYGGAGTPRRIGVHRRDEALRIIGLLDESRNLIAAGGARVTRRAHGQQLIQPAFIAFADAKLAKTWDPYTRLLSVRMALMASMLAASSLMPRVSTRPPAPRGQALPLIGAIKFCYRQQDGVAYLCGRQGVRQADGPGPYQPEDRRRC